MQHATAGIWHPVEGGDAAALSFGAATERGNVRTLNEDGWLAEPPVFVVADGMGGHRAGDAASSIVVEVFTGLAQMSEVDVEAIDACIATCQRRIVDLDTGAPGGAPGTTLVAVVRVIREDAGYWLLASIGDSRAYLLLDGQLEQLTNDHTVVQELVDGGQLAPTDIASHPDRHVITRALGSGEDQGKPDYSLVPVTAGSTLLLCTDGVTSELDDEVLLGLLLRESGSQAVADAIVAAAVQAGGKDNATAVVIKVGGSPVNGETLGRSEIDTDTISGRRRT